MLLLLLVCFVVFVVVVVVAVVVALAVVRSCLELFGVLFSVVCGCCFVCIGHRHTASFSGINTQKYVRELATRMSSRGFGNRRTQAKQVSNDDLMECFYSPTLNHKKC